MSSKPLRRLKLLIYPLLFFFCWANLGIYNIANAATKDSGQGSVASGQKKNKTTEEKFEEALEKIREKEAKVEDKVKKGEGIETEETEIRNQKIEIEKLDVEIKKQFNATEEKIKDLPEEIKQRHRDFVKKYEENLNTLKTNLNAIDKAKTKEEKKQAHQKTKDFLEKTKPPSRHTPLDPNKLPHRTPEIKKKEPRTKPEEFKEEKAENSGRVGYAHHKTSEKQKPILVASNGPLTGLLSPNSELLNPPLSFIGENYPLSPSPLAGEGWGEGLAPNLVVAAATNLPTPADLSETIEVQFTDDIKAKAAELNNSPVKIYEWVRNNIEYVPTYGSIQGADMCLQTKQCNDFDTASLLIALLRTSNISARYVYGTIELPIEKVMNWVGGFTDATSAVNFIASGGIPIKAYTSGGKIAKVQMEHVWVENYIPYGNYRGSMRDDTNKTWISLDGSFKQYTYTNGFDITATVPFDSNAYMSQVQSQNPVHYYQSQIQNYLDANTPDTSIVDVKGYREITQETYHFLPSTLPYKTVAILSRYSSISSTLRATVTFGLSDPYGLSGASYTISTPELAGNRTTLSYLPASSSDEALINAYGGYIYDVPAYLLNLKPVLKIEAIIKLTGDTVNMGSEQNLAIQFSQIGGMAETVQKKLIAGTYYAIGFNLQGINENILGKRNNSLVTNILSPNANTLGNDDLIGEHLYLLATTYHMANDKIYKSGAKLYNVAVTRTISEGITSFPLSVSYVFSIPKTVSPSGVEIDVAMDRIIVVAKDGNVSKEKTYMELSGLTSSYHEHDIFERIDEFSSVSAVRALQNAAASGIPLYSINSSNISQVLPMLQVGTEVNQDIQNAVNAGNEVTISQTNIQINDWNGVGYIVRNPNTGSGAYMISGGLAGGGSTSKADGNQIVELFKGAYAWIKDKLDPQTRSMIVLGANLEIGEEIVANADEIRLAGTSYIDIGRCTGLVIRAYKLAGIDLAALAKKAGRGYPGNVSEMYLLAKNDPTFWVGSGEPILGDIIFFKDTYTRPDSMKREGDDNVTHVGIASGIENAQIKEMIHASGSVDPITKEVKGVVQAEFPVGVTSNSYWGPKLLGLGRPR